MPPNSRMGKGGGAVAHIGQCQNDLSFPWQGLSHTERHSWGLAVYPGPLQLSAPLTLSKKVMFPEGLYLRRR